MEISMKEAAIQIMKYHMKQTLIYKTIKFFRVLYKKMNDQNLVRYLWAWDDENCICERSEVTINEEMECDHCIKKYEKESKMIRLHNIEKETDYYLCLRCANETTRRYEPEKCFIDRIK